MLEKTDLKFVQHTHICENVIIKYTIKIVIFLYFKSPNISKIT